MLSSICYKITGLNKIRAGKLKDVIMSVDGVKEVNFSAGERIVVTYDIMKVAANKITACIKSLGLKVYPEQFAAGAGLVEKNPHSG
ncbi:MAG: hypothetical protein HPY89_00045 [Pelotomaculum sp.]|nr:hypothetical protein [Pelotomaculum sp.]